MPTHTSSTTNRPASLYGSATVSSRLTSRVPGEHHDLVRLSPRSRDQADRPQAVVSHASALVLHELSELLPETIHLTLHG